MNDKLAFLFPGQGAQVVGMGKDFYDRYSSAKEIFQIADDLLGRPLSKIIFEGPLESLTETKNSQSAIFVVSFAILKVLQEQFSSLSPLICAGLSLGEYTALAASSRITFEECLPLVQKRADAMNQACLKNKGTMAAVFGLSSEKVEALVNELNLPEDLWTANFNCPGQIVISGTLKGVEAGSKAAKEKGAKMVIPLNVHGAFHSGLMKEAKNILYPYVYAAHIHESQVRFVMNVSGKSVSDPQTIRENLIEQITSPVRWEQSIKGMMDEVSLFLEIGPGKTLAGMNRQMKAGETLSINKLEDLDKLAQIIG